MPQEREHYVDTGITVEHAHDLDGREYDATYVAEIVDDLRQQRSGRPSLTGQAKPSPRLQLRVTPDLDRAIVRAAKADRLSKAAWMRRVLSKAAERA